MCKKLSNFERWQVGLSGIQTILLVVATIAAIYIGLQQSQINQRLYELNFSVAIEVTHDSQSGQLNIFNKGRENIWLYGTKLGSSPKSVEKDGRLIAPGGSYYLLTDKLQQEVLQKVGEKGDIHEFFNIYLKDATLRPYTVSVILFIQVSDGEMTIHTQTVSIKQKDW